MSDEPKLFALDHNFPQPIIEAAALSMTEAELIPVQDIDERLPGFSDDWEILLALARHEQPWHGLVTTDSSMIQLPKELAVLLQTKLTLVVADAAGHDPLKATGLVLTHIEGIARRSRLDTAQLWQLRSALRGHNDPWQRLNQIAERREVSASELYDEVKLSEEELRRDPLA